MQTIFITGSNPYGYPIGSTQSVADSVAQTALSDIEYGGGWGKPGNTVKPLAVTPQDREKAASQLQLTSAQLVQLQSLVSGAGNLPAVGVVDTVCMGDSFTARGNAYGTITAASRANNVVTVTVAGHGMATGMSDTFSNFADASYNAQNTPVTYIDGNTLSYASIGAAGSTTNLDGLANGSTKKPMTMVNRSGQADNGWFMRLKSLAKGSIRIVHNGGSPGNTAADARTRFPLEVPQFTTAKLMAIGFGYNDFALFGRTADAVLADMTWMAQQARALGMLVVIYGASPWVNGGTSANRAEAVRYNRLLRAYCNVNPGIRFADAGKYLIDATNATYNYPLANMIAGDGVHPTPKGANQIAQAIWDQLSPGWQAPSLLVESNADCYGANNLNRNILDFAPWAATGGSVNPPVTGTCPQGYAVYATNTSGTGTFAVVGAARSDGKGNDLQFTVSAGGASDNFIINFASAIGGGRFVAGDKLRMIFQITLSGTANANLKGILAGFYFQGGTQNPQPNVIQPSATSAAEYGAADEVITFVSEDIVVPSDGATSFGFQMYVNFAGASTGALVGKFGVASIEKQ